MEIRYEKHWSGYLNREMEFKIYGSCGKPVLFIPCQAGRFFDFENFHMDDVFRPWIDAGKIMVFSCDTIDGETWADKGGDKRRRTMRLRVRRSGRIRTVRSMRSSRASERAAR